MSASKVLQDYIFASKYARYLPEKKRRETWGEAVDRVRNMMLTQYEGCGIEDDINWAYDLMRKKRVLGSQRALQFGGDPVFKKHARVYNCVSAYADRPRFFQEYFWLLLCGCGAGFSVQRHHVAKLPNITIPRKNKVIKTFSIPDTIEGWSDAVGILLTTYWNVPASPEFADWVGYEVEFDYSLIREKGAYLSSGVGKAPGPSGLRKALNNIRSLLDRVTAEKVSKLRPIHVYDICMHIADAVLSGGVRRSASIAVFSADDLEMAMAKTGNWLQENPQRARSNNSALLVRGKTTKAEFKALMQHVKECGEPGFVWADSPEFLVNPCVEIGFFCYDIVDEDKFNAWKKATPNAAITCDPAKIGLESGWQGCNLTTTNCSRLGGETTEEKTEYYMKNVRAAAIIGTLQAGFTTFKYLTKASENIFRREALLGVSMTGMMDNFDIVLDPVVQSEAAKLVLKVNGKLAKKIGINPCARGTCLKPEGTGTLILGSSAHGCHPHHYVRYLRVVQANTDENIYKYFKEANSQACEPSRWSANNTDDVVFFPIEVPDGAKTKNQLPAIDLLKIVKSTQQNWVNRGKRKDRCVMPWLSHNVSNTVSINPDEWEGVEDFIFANRKHFAGISFVPNSADKDYAQAPNCAVYTSRQIVKEYGEAALWTSGLIELGLRAFDYDLWAACVTLLDPDYVVEIDDDELDSKVNFYQRCHRFAGKYFDGDIKRLTYCMKDVFNWKRWLDLSRTLEEVDYTKLIEQEDNTKLEQQIACSGGSCTLV